MPGYPSDGQPIYYILYFIGILGVFRPTVQKASVHATTQCHRWRTRLFAWNAQWIDSMLPIPQGFPTFSTLPCLHCVSSYCDLLCWNLISVAAFDHGIDRLYSIAISTNRMFPFFPPLFFVVPFAILPRSRRPSCGLSECGGELCHSLMPVSRCVPNTINNACQHRPLTSHGYEWRL